MQQGPRLELTPRPLPARGDLAVTPFAILLANARALGESGVLSLHEQKLVYLWNGEPVGVRTNFPDEISEVYMLRHGLVAESDLARVRQTASTRKQRFGEALLNLGYLEPNELFEHTRRQSLQNLTSCFRWEQGPIEWTPTRNLGADIVPVPVDLVDLFVTGVSRFYDRGRLDRELPVADTARVYAKPPPGTPTSRSSLGTVDARIFQIAAGRPTLLSLCHAVGLADKTIRQRLYVLYCLGYIGFEKDPGMVIVRPASRVATIPAFTSPVAQAPRIPTPTPQMPPAAVPTRMPTRTMASPAPRDATVRAPSRSSSLPPARSSRPPSRPPGGMSVEALVEEAEISRVAGQFHVALGTLRSALELAPESPIVLAELALTLMLCEPRLHAREANRLAREARRLDPNLSTSYVVMGLLMEQIGETARARQLYQFALERDAMCGEAMNCLEKLGGMNEPS